MVDGPNRPAPDGRGCGGVEPGSDLARGRLTHGHPTDGAAPMQITITEDARQLIEARGGIVAIDFITPVG